MIGLVEFLKAAGVEFQTDSLKVHLACWDGISNPLDVYYAGKFKSWQESQTRKNFECKQVLSLIDLGQSNWLFAGLYQILDRKQDPENEKLFIYSTRVLPNQESLVGRVIVHHKRSRASYVWYKSDIILSLVELRREKMTIGDFPGYNAVIISHSNLKVITGQRIASWYGALANIKGIYLITDTMTGKHYVGKASGNEGIWQRWCAYAENGHGGNLELKKVLKSNGSEYMRHFQYSILEIADSHASDADILVRESYWMKVLKTREFGMNS
jgi:hypothetical protein